MFRVWDFEGLQKAYVPGIVRQSRAHGDGEEHHSEPKNTPPEYKAALESYQNTPLEFPKEVISAKDIMTKPAASVGVLTTVAQASEIITKRRYRHLPVLNEAGQPVGMISDRDVLRFSLNAFENHIDLAATPVSKIMAPEVLTAGPDADIREVVRVMLDEHVGSIPIVGTDGNMLGIITRSDILRSAMKHGPLTLWV